MKFKRFFAALSAAAMIASVSAVNVSANLPQTPSAGDNCYLQFETTSQGAIIMGAVNESGAPAGITQIGIPEKTDAGVPIIGIGGFAFADCENLTDVIVPDTITQLNDAAFLKEGDINAVLEANGINTKVDANAAADPKAVAYAANITEFMGRNDWNGDEAELADAVPVFNNVRKTVGGETLGESVKRIYNCKDLSTIVRASDENTLEKMSEKSYSNFEAWVKTIPYVDLTVVADKDSYAAQYAKGKEILKMKYAELEKHLTGDANRDGIVNVRDCATIARAMAFPSKFDEIITCWICADYNGDEKVTIRDAAQLAHAIAIGEIK